MNALDFDRLSDIEKRKFGNYCNKALKKRLKKIGNEINKFERKNHEQGQTQEKSES